MSINKNFTIEDLEIIRIIIGQKAKSIKGNIANFESKTDLKPEVKEKRIADATQQYCSLALIEAKCMSQQSEMTLKNN